MRILLVEDDYLVANALRRDLEGLGCDVVGPVPSVDRGLALVRERDIDGAILDVNVIGGTSEPIARQLRSRRLPFFFITGYASPEMLSHSLHTHLRLKKPIDETMLVRALQKTFSTST